MAELFPNRLKQLRLENDFSQQKMADILGVSDTTYQNYEYEARAIPGKALVRAAEYFNVSSDYVLCLTDYRNDEPDDGYVPVPVLGEIAAGDPIEAIEIDKTFPVPQEIIKQHPRAFLLRVSGDSYNRKIPNGYYALVDPDDVEPNEKDPFAVCVNGNTATIKRVKRLSNGFELIPNSYDPTYTPIIYDYNRDDTALVTIIGKVVWATMPFDYDL